jgi:hypothetical protein
MRGARATIVAHCAWIKRGREVVEVPSQLIALCEASGASPQAALRGMAAMLCGLRYDEDNRLVALDGVVA